MKRYKVTLTPEERCHLRDLITTGKAAAQRLARARILLKADACPSRKCHLGRGRLGAIGLSRLRVIGAGTAPMAQAVGSLPADHSSTLSPRAPE